MRFGYLVVLASLSASLFAFSPFALGQTPTSDSSPEELRAYLSKLEEKKNKISKLDYLLSKGTTLEDLGMHIEALREFDEAVELYPQTPDCLGCRSRLYEKMKRWREAIADESKLIEMGVRVSNNLILRGLNKLELNDPVGAQRDAEASLKLDSKDACGWRCRGEAQLQLGDNSGALESFNHAIELDPSKWSGYHYRAFAYKKLNQLEKAQQDIRKARLHGWKEPKLDWE